jgi:hypothetical protein
MARTDELQSPDAKTRLTAAFELAKLGEFTGEETILRGLVDDDREVRIKAASYCGQVGFAHAVEPLIRMATSDRESHNRNQAMYALVGVGRIRGVAGLIEALKDEEEERRGDARTSLYRLLGRSVVALLADDFELDAAEPVRLAAWWQQKEAAFDPALVYAAGDPTSPGGFIEQLKKMRRNDVPEATLDALECWTDVRFGGMSRKKLIAAWEKWWDAQRERYQTGCRYFYGHRVP